MRGVRQKAWYATPGRARRSAAAAAVLLLVVAATATAGTMPVWVVPGVARLAPLAPPPGGAG